MAEERSLLERIWDGIKSTAKRFWDGITTALSPKTLVKTGLWIVGINGASYGLGKIKPGLDFMNVAKAIDGPAGVEKDKEIDRLAKQGMKQLMIGSALNFGMGFFGFGGGAHPAEQSNGELSQLTPSANLPNNPQNILQQTERERI